MVVPLVSKLATIQTKVDVLKMQLVSGVTIKHGIVWYWVLVSDINYLENGDS